MIDPDTQVAGKNPKEDNEDASVGILMTALSKTHRARLVHVGGSLEAFDGVIRFFQENDQPLMESEDSNGSPVFTSWPKYQLKSTETKDHHFDCDKKLLRRCFHSNEPVFLIMVDIINDIIYYECLSKHYISTKLGILDMGAEAKGGRVHFERVFTGDIDEMIGSYKTEERNLRDFNEFGVASDEEVANYKNSVKALAREDNIAAFDLEALLYYHFPVRDSGPKIEAIRDTLKISVATFDYLIEKLETIGAIKKVGSIYTLLNVPISKTLLAELVEREGMNYLND